MIRKSPVDTVGIYCEDVAKKRVQIGSVQFWGAVFGESQESISLTEVIRGCLRCFLPWETSSPSTLGEVSPLCACSAPGLVPLSSSSCLPNQAGSPRKAGPRRQGLAPPHPPPVSPMLAQPLAQGVLKKIGGTSEGKHE